MVTLTKQDVQNVIDNARNRLQERIASRQDLQAVQESIRVLNTNLQQSQQLLRQAEFQRVQMIRRTVSMETRMLQLEHELQNMRRAIVQLAEARPTERITERVIMAQPEKGGRSVERGYNYNPTPAN